MSRKARHNARIRARILSAAGDTFRRDGYASAGLNAIMQRAGLTRGAFYAHFPSKAALFCAVLAEDDLLLRLLRSRSAASPDALGLGLCYLFDALLRPVGSRGFAGDWGLPHLMREAALGDPAAREAYERTLAAILEEMARGLPVAGHANGHRHAHGHACGHGCEPALRALLAQACGAVAMAAACESEDLANALLTAARQSVRATLADIVQGGRNGLPERPDAPCEEGRTRVVSAPGAGPSEVRTGPGTAVRPGTALGSMPDATVKDIERLRSAARAARETQGFP